MTTTTATTATVSLKAYNTYNFHVTATNAVGTSNPSEMSESHTTPAREPIVNPEGVRGSGPEPGLMVVSWDVSVFKYCLLYLVLTPHISHKVSKADERSFSVCLFCYKNVPKLKE